MASLVDWFLKEQEPSHARAAIAAMRAQQTTGLAPRDAYRRALAELNGEDAILAGYLSDGGDDVRIGLRNESRHTYTGGITGGGKTRSFLNTLEHRFLGSLRGGGIDAEILDPKGETFMEMQLCIAGIWLAADEKTRAAISALVYVIDWTDNLGSSRVRAPSIDTSRS